MTLAIPVTSLAPDRIDRAAAMLARAFQDDPLFVYLAPDAQRRPTALVRYFAPTARYAARYGVVDAVRDQIPNGDDGLALWLGPGHTTMTFLGMVRTGMLTAPFAFGWAGLGRLSAVTRVTEQLHRRRAAEPHWYLLGLAVEPERQGQGIGAALLTHGLVRADATGSPCYLETLRERTAHYYERFGFRVIDTRPIAPDGPPFWALKRERVLSTEC